MAKTSSVEKYKKQLKKIALYRERHTKLKAIVQNQALTAEERQDAQRKLAKIPRRALPVQLRLRCELTGRTRGIYRKFKLCRHKFRELAHKGLLPGVSKASW